MLQFPAAHGSYPSWSRGVFASIFTAEEPPVHPRLTARRTLPRQLQYEHRNKKDIIDADTQAILDRMATGKPIDRDVYERIQSRGNKITEEIRAKHGTIEIAVDLIREHAKNEIVMERCVWAKTELMIAYHDEEVAYRCMTTDKAVRVFGFFERAQAGVELGNDSQEARELPEGVRRVRYSDHCQIRPSAKSMNS